MIKKITNENDIIHQIAETEKKYFSHPLAEHEIKLMAVNPAYEILSFQKNGQLLSYIVATVGEYECQIIKLASTKKRMGYGKKILAAFIEKHKGKNIYLEVRLSNNDAISLYNSCGFIIDGIRKNLYDSPDEDGIIMHFSNEGI